MELDSPRRLTRNQKDKMIAGVCSGIADYMDVDSTIVRLLFAFALIFAGTGLLIYLIMWIIMPKSQI